MEVHEKKKEVVVLCSLTSSTNVKLGSCTVTAKNCAKKPLCTCKAFVLLIQTSSVLVFDFVVTVAVFVA